MPLDGRAAATPADGRWFLLNRIGLGSGAPMPDGSDSPQNHAHANAGGRHADDDEDENPGKHFQRSRFPLSDVARTDDRG
jgi:hypothetical protein